MAMDEVVDRVFGSVIDQLMQQSRLSKYLNDPVLFASDVLGIDLWSKQQDVLNEMVESTHTAVRSCHGSGKSLLASVIACWWIATRPLGEAIVVTTAPTFAQVHAILWEDIRKHHLNAEIRYKEGKSPMKLPGHITQSDNWKSDDGVLLGFGRKPADNNDHGFQGIHRRYVLVIVDESCGIRENLFTAIEAITTTENSRILAIGNPDDPATQFHKFFTTYDNWANIDISSYDSPNFTRDHAGHYDACTDEREQHRIWCMERQWAKRWDRDKNVSADLLPLLPNHEWVNQRLHEWGDDSALWMSKVLGQFPLQSVNTLFNRETLNRGHDCQIKPLSTSKVILGVDLSRFGPDYSTVYMFEEGPILNEEGKPTRRTGGKLRLVDFWGGKADELGVDGMESAARVHQIAQQYGASEVRIDAEGVGGPILDQITRLSEGSYMVVAMRGSRTSPDKYRWLNGRAYWYEKLRERMFLGEIDIDPEDKKLELELEAIQYHFKNQYKSLQIESKEDMEKRGVKSPDFADAAVYASADMSYVTDSPFGHLGYGDRVVIDPRQLLGLVDGAPIISPY